jgi:hypothetical protein
MQAVSEVLGDPVARQCGIYLLTLFGTIATYVFGMQRGFEGAVSFLRRVLPGRSDAFYHRTDFILVSVFGSMIGAIIFDPHNAFQALAAGCGWVGALNVLLSGRGAPGAAGV